MIENEAGESYNRLPGTDAMITWLAANKDDSRRAFHERLNVLSQDIWASEDDPEKLAIEAHVGRVAPEHIMEIQMVLREICEAIIPLLNNLPEAESDIIADLTKQAYPLY
ncbi:MAG: hypothetical protein DDT34_01156 [Firmicutes bacterium]|nr:hypothetical protein [Bacillota bacterium]